MKKENINIQITDQEIIHGIKSRNEDVLYLAMQKYESYFYAVGGKIIAPYGTNEDIAECFVDTWFYIWDKIDTYDTKKYSFLNWCLLIFKSRIINRRIYNIKQMEKYQKIALNNLSDIDADNILIDRESYNELVNAIRLLPDPKDKIFMMKYVQDKSLKEIAIGTRLSIKQIYYHIHRGKKLLKSYLLNQKEREFDEKEHFQ